MSSLHSLFIVVIERSHRVISQALKQSSSSLLADVFGEKHSLVYTSFGYNAMYDSWHSGWKRCQEDDCSCVTYICDARLFPVENSYIEQEI